MVQGAERRRGNKRNVRDAAHGCFCLQHMSFKRKITGRGSNVKSHSEVGDIGAERSTKSRIVRGAISEYHSGDMGLSHSVATNLKRLCDFPCYSETQERGGATCAPTAQLTAPSRPPKAHSGTLVSGFPG